MQAVDFMAGRSFGEAQHDQILDLRGFSRSAASPFATAIIFLRDQSAMPGQQGCLEEAISASGAFSQLHKRPTPERARRRDVNLTSSAHYIPATIKYHVSCTTAQFSLFTNVRARPWRNPLCRSKRVIAFCQLSTFPLPQSFTDTIRFQADRLTRASPTEWAPRLSLLKTKRTFESLWSAVMPTLLSLAKAC